MLTGQASALAARPLEIHVFDASACGFPRPRVPLLPDGLAGLKLEAAPAPGANDAAHYRRFTRGRYALREAYRLAGLGPGTALLAPAYHCRTMIDPAFALGADVLLYRLRPDLSPDPASIDDLLGQTRQPIKAVLATHFFGLPAVMDELRARCARHGAAVIEDCSHVLFTEHHRPPGVGTYGDYVVSSPYKFLPSPDGGLLYGRDPARLATVAQRTPSATAELRGVGRALAAARAHHRSARRLDAGGIDAELAAIAALPGPTATESRAPAACSAAYLPADEGLTALRVSRLIHRHADVAAITRRRREHYRRWAEAVAGLASCRALYPDLPDGCAPYMFPLHVDDAEDRFYRLKRLGMPIWRWDSIAAADCPTAADYRLHLLHLPCHQALTAAEIDWMIGAVRKVMALRGGRAAP